MRLTILTAGSRGDVAPFVTLARAAQRAGHRVRLGAPADAEGLVRGQGVPYVSLGPDYQALAASPDGRAALAGHPRAVLRLLAAVRAGFRTTLDAAWEAARDAEALVAHPKVLAAPDLAEALGIPAFLALPVPLLVPTRAFPAPLGPLPDLGPLNPLTYAASRVGALPFRGVVTAWRRERLALPARGVWADPYAPASGPSAGRPLPVLYALSRHLVPPAPDAAARWPSGMDVTGYWFDEEWAAAEAVPEERAAGGPDGGPDGVPGALAAFVAAGPPPVYIGFGSMAARHPERVTAAVLAAVRAAGVRAVMATGWGGLAGAAASAGTDAGGDGSVHVVDAVPHAWLLPRCAAVVHHGGAGTTHAGLRAGRPTVVCPVAADQFFWGGRVQALGAGPAPIPQRALARDDGAARLAAALRAACASPSLRARAAALGTALRAEDGVAAAVRRLEQATGSGADAHRPHTVGG
jgi:sterol 3beta-glucosyltransferase